MKAYLAIQCQAPTGEIGSWLFTRNVNGNRDLVSPVFDGLHEFYSWARANGWIAESYTDETRANPCGVFNKKAV